MQAPSYGPSEGVSSLKSFVSKGSSTNKETSKLKAILEDLKIQLRQRGAKGFIGLQRKFRIMDDNGDQALSYLEFKKGMKECALNLTDEVQIVIGICTSTCKKIVIIVLLYVTANIGLTIAVQIFRPRWQWNDRFQRAPLWVEGAL